MCFYLANPHMLLDSQSAMPHNLQGLHTLHIRKSPQNRVYLVHHMTNKVLDASLFGFIEYLPLAFYD